MDVIGQQLALDRSDPTRDTAKQLCQEREGGHRCNKSKERAAIRRGDASADSRYESVDKPAQQIHDRNGEKALSDQEGEPTDRPDASGFPHQSQPVHEEAQLGHGAAQSSNRSRGDDTQFTDHIFPRTYRPRLSKSCTITSHSLERYDAST